MNSKGTSMFTQISATLLALFVLSLGSSALRADEPFVGVVCTDYATGKFSTLTAEDPWTATIDAATICPDAVARWHDGLVYVVNRLGCDNIQVLDPAQGFATALEFSVGGGANPQDIAFAAGGGKAYVPRQERDDVLVVDPATGDWLGSIDLSGWADADGSAELGSCVISGGLLLVAVLRLDRDFYWTPVGDSYLAVVDTATDQLVDANPGQPGVQAIPLVATNPAWELNLGPDGLIYATCVGHYGLADGGLERIDPVGLARVGRALDEAARGGDVGDVAVVDDGSAWAVVSDASFVTKLKRFDPSTGGSVELVADGGGYVFFDLELGCHGELFLGDQSFGAAGVRVYDAATAELLSPAISVGLPPYDLVAPACGDVGVPDLPGAAPLVLDAWPNPFNPRTTLHWRGLPAGSAVLTIQGVDGRRVARIPLGEQTGEGDYLWEGKGTRGRALTSGVYLARVESVGRVASARLVLLK